MKYKFVLPKRENTFKTERGDPVYLHYNLPTGWMYKKRLINTLSLLNKNNKKLLDVGYGSGILFPSLLNFSETCYGLEIHGKEKNIYEMLSKEALDNNRVILREGSILNIPFPNEFFDSIVSVSTLEHMNPNGELDKSLKEIHRVLKDNGIVVLSFPIRNIITDWFYEIVGFKPRDIHPSSHNNIINVAKKYFIIEKILKFPSFRNINFSLYCTIRCKKK